MTIALVKKEFNIRYDLISMKGISEIRVDFSLKGHCPHYIVHQHPVPLSAAVENMMHMLL